MEPRVVWVSNRLSVRVIAGGDDGLVVAPSSGGLATALRDLQTSAEAHWIGWPGDVPPELHEQATRMLAEIGATAVFLTADEVKSYYDGFSNAVLWPLLHSNFDKLPLDVDATWPVFAAVNRRFAEQCSARAALGDTIWLHDFHLALVPSLVREQVADAEIGFFLHVPFPPADVFCSLPRWREIACGLLGANLIGFHTDSFLTCFREVACRLGARVIGNRVEFAGRSSELGVFPIGVDFKKIDKAASSTEVVRRANELRSEAQGRQILLGVDRLDYTKGIPRRLLAIERMLLRWPELASRVHFIQIAVPTRENVDAYADFRQVVNGIVGRINGRFGTPTGVPIHFVHREIPFEELLALYRAADIMIVTPLRDGMNLVCKEYVAARGDERGALVLSEFAGAAGELKTALKVNPFDLDEVAARIRDGMTMPVDEQRARIGAMRQVVKTADVRSWAASFVAALKRRVERSSERHLTEDLVRAAQSKHLHVLLDYDGTLVALAPTPSEAKPDRELRELLTALASLHHTSVKIVSGRSIEELVEWFGDLPIGLCAEHGAHELRAGEAAWAMSAPPEWFADAAALLTRISENAAGTFVEKKRCSLALHTRSLSPSERRHVEGLAIAELREQLQRGASILRGDCVIEVRDGAINKSRALRSLRLDDGDLIVAAGDDVTDDDLFCALPSDSIMIGVGGRATHVRHRVMTAMEVRSILRRLIALRSRADAVATPRTTIIHA